MKYTRLFLIAPVLVVVLTMIGATTPNVYAKHQSDTDRYNVGYTDGSNAASSDSTYNAACDPNNTHLQNGNPHTVPYCNGWANGYTTTWNSNHGGQQGSGNQQPQQSSGGSGIVDKAINACLNHLTTCASIVGSVLP